MKEALKLALAALENHEGNYKLGKAGCDRQEAAITAIKEALAQPAQEFPVNWASMIHYPDCWDTAAYPELRDAIHEVLAWGGCSVCKAQPVQEPDELTIAYMSGLYDGKKKRPWVGLTDEEASWCQAPSTIQTWKRIEAKLKEKNNV